MSRIAVNLLFLIGFTTAAVLNSPKANTEFQRIFGRDTHETLLKSQAKINDGEFTNEFWHNEAKKVVEDHLKKKPNTKKARNIIFFLGDGLSHPSIAAARMYLGDENKKLSFEEFSYTANSKTYCVDKQVSDSACTATAYLTGVKARGSTIGLNAKATRRNCEDGMNEELHTESIASWAQKAGKDTGIVTTTRVTHASPAGVYAHIAYRHWEDDYNVKRDRCDPDLVDDITEQLVHGEVGKNLNVIFGGGSRRFVNETEIVHGITGYREDGKNLIEDWKKMKESRVYVDDRASLMNLNPSKVDQVLGLFDASHIPYHLNILRDGLQEEKPTLKDMTEKAIEILSKNENGFFLFVEGGRIDHGHHETRAKYAIDETVEFSKAIEAALKIVDTEETLIVVTADHSHVMTIAGYAPRGNDIFGMAGVGSDKIPYTTLSYGNGPGYDTHWKIEGGGRVDPTSENLAEMFTKVNAVFPATLPRVEETHGGDDVGIWAKGPWAHLFQGTLEQHVIPHIMAYASCIGDGLKMCEN